MKPTTTGDYYAYRAGATRETLDISLLRRVVARLFEEYESKGWFQKYLGKDCVDAHVDVGAYVLDELGVDLWPLSAKIGTLSEEWLFSVIEFLHRHASRPIDTFEHNWGGCGLHVREADDESGRAEILNRMNALLSRYEPKYELQSNGEIWASAPTGLEDIAPVGTQDPKIDERVKSAARLYRRYGATVDDKRNAVRDLADVFEHLRATVGTQLPSKDEGDLFTIANQFGIRHHNPTQKTQYDSGIWLDWVFYSFLSSIALANQLLLRRSNS